MKRTFLKISGTILAVIISVGMIAGCAAKKEEGQAVESKQASATTEPAKTVDYTTGYPWLCPMVPGNVTEETNIDLKDNYIVAVRKDYFVNSVIPDGYSKMHPIVERRIEVKNQIQGLLEKEDALASHDAQLARSLYKMYLDWDSRNELGMEPIRPIIEKIEAIKTIDDLNKYQLENPIEDVAVDLYGIGIQPNPFNASQQMVGISYPSLIMDDSDTYRKESDMSKAEKQAYDEFFSKLLKKYGYDENAAKDIIEKCYSFEKYMAGTIYSTEERYSPDYDSKISNIFTQEQLNEICGSLPISEFVKKYGYDVSEYVVSCPDAVKALASYYTDEHIEEIKAYMILVSIEIFATRLDRECYDAKIERNNKIHGTTGKVADEEAAVEFVRKELIWPTARLFCEAYFTEADKTRLKNVIDDVKKAYGEMLSEETFISEETKAKAIEKLDNLYIRCLYPDDWSPYDCSDINFAGVSEGGNLVEACKAINKHIYKVNVEKSKKPVDKAIWNDGITPTEGNAFYDPVDNSVNILAGITGGALYDTNMTDEELYASMGAIIGHEISHAFDTSGAQYDKDGNFANWWTDEDKATFEKKIQKVVDYFNGITAWEGAPINGQILTSEACADMGGIACMLHIAKGIENFDYDKFFRSYAKVWNSLAKPEDILNRLGQDSHPMDYLRVNTVVQQFDEFYETYGIKEGDGMYLAPEDRIAIW